MEAFWERLESLKSLKRMASHSDHVSDISKKLKSIKEEPEAAESVEAIPDANASGASSSEEVMEENVATMWTNYYGGNDTLDTLVQTAKVEVKARRANADDEMVSEDEDNCGDEGGEAGGRDSEGAGVPCTLPSPGGWPERRPASGLS